MNPSQSLWSILKAFAYSLLLSYQPHFFLVLRCGASPKRKTGCDASVVRIIYVLGLHTCPTIPQKTCPPRPGLYPGALRNSESLTTGQPQSTWRDAVYMPCASLDSYMAVHQNCATGYQPGIWPWEVFHLRGQQFELYPTHTFATYCSCYFGNDFLCLSCQATMGWSNTASCFLPIFQTSPWQPWTWRSLLHIACSGLHNTRCGFMSASKFVCVWCFSVVKYHLANKGKNTKSRKLFNGNLHPWNALQNFACRQLKALLKLLHLWHRDFILHRCCQNKKSNK